MEYCGFELKENMYSIEGSNLYAFTKNDDGSKSKILVFEKRKKYYILSPHFIKQKEQAVFLYNRSAFKNTIVKIDEGFLDFFRELVMDNDILNIKKLEFITELVHDFYKKQTVIFNSEKNLKLYKDTIYLNHTSIASFLKLEPKTKKMDSILRNVKFNIKREILVKSNLLKSSKRRKSIYKTGVVDQFLSATLLPYSSKTIEAKLGNNDIVALEKTISKVSSKLSLKVLKSIYERKIIENAIKVGNKILRIKKEQKSKTTIKTIYNKYLKDKQFDKFFNRERLQIEKLWEAYLTKFSTVIFEASNEDVKNQFKIKKTNRSYKPDFVLNDIYGGKTIIEIKTHLPSVIKYDKSHDSLYYSSSTSMAIGQLQGYIKKVVLSENDDKEYFSSAKGLIIIGQRIADQSTNLNEIKVPPKHDRLDYYYKSIRDLNSSLVNIEITYFDDIISTLEKRLSNLINS